MRDVKNGCVQELKSGLHMQSNRTTVTMADTDGSSDMGEKSHFIVIHFKIMGQNLWVRVSSMNHYALVQYLPFQRPYHCWPQDGAVAQLHGNGSPIKGHEENLRWFK